MMLCCIYDDGQLSREKEGSKVPILAVVKVDYGVCYCESLFSQRHD